MYAGRSLHVQLWAISVILIMTCRFGRILGTAYEK
jgi:hypothetical protein